MRYQETGSDWGIPGDRLGLGDRIREQNTTEYGRKRWRIRVCECVR